MPRKTFTYRETRDAITYLDEAGTTIATVKPGSDIPVFILLGMSKQGHALKDADTGEYLCGRLDELLGEDR